MNTSRATHRPPAFGFSPSTLVFLPAIRSAGASFTRLDPRRFFSFILFLALLAVPAQATQYDWTGATNGNITDTTNWSSAPGFISTDVLRWNSASYGNATTANGSISVGELLFDAGNTGGITFGAGTGTLTLAGVSGIGIQVNSGSGAVSTGGARFALGGSQTWSNNSGNLLTVGGTITNSGTTPYTLTINGTGNTLLGGVINDNGTGTIAISKSDAGTLTLSGANTFTGGITLNSGILRVDREAELGAASGGVTLGGGVLSTASTFANSARTLNVSSASSFDVATNFTTIWNGPVTGTGTLTKTGGGTLSFNSSSGNTFSGSITLGINGGTLKIGGNN